MSAVRSASRAPSRRHPGLLGFCLSRGDFVDLSTVVTILPGWHRARGTGGCSAGSLGVRSRLGCSPCRRPRPRAPEARHPRPTAPRRPRRASCTRRFRRRGSTCCRLGTLPHQAFPPGRGLHQGPVDEVGRREPMVGRGRLLHAQPLTDQARRAHGQRPARSRRPRDALAAQGQPRPGGRAHPPAPRRRRATRVRPPPPRHRRRPPPPRRRRRLPRRRR